MDVTFELCRGAETAAADATKPVHHRKGPIQRYFRSATQSGKDFAVFRWMRVGERVEQIGFRPFLGSPEGCLREASGSGGEVAAVPSSARDLRMVPFFGCAAVGQQAGVALTPRDACSAGLLNEAERWPLR